MSACPACWASSRSTCTYNAHTGRSPRPSTMSCSIRRTIVRRDAAHLAWCAARTDAMVSDRVSVNERSGVLAIPICRYDRPVTA